MLGNRLQSFGVNKVQLFSRTLVGLVGLIIAGSLLTANYRGGLLWNLASIIAIPLFIGIAIVGLWLIFTTIKTLWKMPCLEVYEHGVKLISRQKEQTWFWEDIQYIQGRIMRDLYYDIPLLTSGSYRFSNDYMELFRLDNFYARLPEAYVLIANHVNTRLLPVSRQRLQEGETLNFGSIKLSSTIVSTEKKQLTLSGVSGISIRQGVVSIQSWREPITIAVMLDSVVNPALLMTLVKELSKDGMLTLKD